MIKQEEPTSAIVFRKLAAFNPHPHLVAIKQKLSGQVTEVAALRASFRLIDYTTTRNFSFKLGFGGKEPAHVNLPTYQALLVIDPQRWLLKSPRESYKGVFQEAGDVIILDADTSARSCLE